MNAVRMSRLFFKTLREVPSEADMPGHRLLLRTGMVRRLSAGIYGYTPLAWRVVRKIEELLRWEMDALGAQEVGLPVAQPAELWKESGRYTSIGPELARWRDRTGREMVLAAGHEEAAADLARAMVESYRQLPLAIYQIQIKFRDERRPRGGLARAREFISKDAYSFHRDQEDLDAFYEKVIEVYRKIFRECGLEVMTAQSDPGIPGGGESHEFVFPSPFGEDTLVACRKCGYAANQELARAGKTPARERKAPAAAAEEVPTPGAEDIESVARYLGVPESQTLKVVLYSAGGRLIMAAIRGDLEVSEAKLRSALARRGLMSEGAELPMAASDEVSAAGLVPGYTSPAGLADASRVFVVADDSLAGTRNLVAGANRPGYHLINVDVERDLKFNAVEDIARVAKGQPCPHCGAPVEVFPAIEVGQAFKLGTRYSGALGAKYLDADGKEKPLMMGSFEIGVGRLLACVVEANHDGDGIIWPAPVAPYQVHLVSVGASDEVVRTADELYHELVQSGVEVLYDDRDEKPGAKFKDADLLGMPLRVTVSPRTLARGATELRFRKNGMLQDVPLSESSSGIRRALAGLEAESLANWEATPAGLVGGPGEA